MFVLVFLQCILIASVESLTFKNAIRPLSNHHSRSPTRLHMSTTVPENDTIRAALQKMRGISVSVEFKTKEAKSISEVEMLSQELRKAKVASIFVSDVEHLGVMINEQEGAKGNFPGPCPIIFNGGCKEELLDLAIENGATCVVYKPGTHYTPKLNKYVHVISEVASRQDIQNAIQEGHGNMFLLSASGKSNEEIQNILNEIPKDSLVIASLDAMQPNSHEISQGKEIVSWTNDHGSKISALLISNACIGDAEDLKYASFVVENMYKKSSSTFKMTGLTGSSNGHFGSNQSGGIATAKWNRQERQMSLQSKVPF